MNTAKILPEPVALRVALDDLIDAMEYHIEQTRPIELSTVALAAARIALAQPESALTEFVAICRWFESIPDGRQDSQEESRFKAGQRDAATRIRIAIVARMKATTTNPEQDPSTGHPPTCPRP
jgi:hypothetical protein